MGWSGKSELELRREFVELAGVDGANRRELARRYKVSPTTAYKWIGRFKAEGPEGLQDRSRCPHSQPRRSSRVIEEAAVSIHDWRPWWGARKVLETMARRGVADLPTPSTVHAILRRHGRVRAAAASSQGPFQRFERPEPMDLLQVDFKGHFAMRVERCHPLTALDDHSRFNLCLEAFGSETTANAQQGLTKAFRRYGLPKQMLSDNGHPFAEIGSFSTLELWLMRLGIECLHGRPRHPQTQGKEERFHRTLKLEVLRDNVFNDLSAVQTAFDRWRHEYNVDRPHDALDLRSPVSRFQPSSRSFPEHLPPIEYSPGDQVRRVQSTGRFSFKGKEYRVGRAFKGQPVALRPTLQDGTYDVYYCRTRVLQIDQTVD